MCSIELPTSAILFLCFSHIGSLDGRPVRLTAQLWERTMASACLQRWLSWKTRSSSSLRSYFMHRGSQDLIHGPLEAIFTSEEETTMVALARVVFRPAVCCV